MRNPPSNSTADPVSTPVRSQAQSRHEGAEVLGIQETSAEPDQLFTTHNSLSVETRAVMAGLLNACLVDAIDLTLQTHVAHWNVKGPRFLPLHSFFDQMHKEIDEWSDILAERAVQLGGRTEAVLGNIADRTHLPVYSTRITSAHEHLDALSSSLSTFGKNIRVAIQTAGKAGDPGTMDLLTQILRSADKLLWMLEAQYQETQ